MASQTKQSSDNAIIVWVEGHSTVTGQLLRTTASMQIVSRDGTTRPQVNSFPTVKLKVMVWVSVMVRSALKPR